jgi:hypothetical protein
MSKTSRRGSSSFKRTCRRRRGNGSPLRDRGELPRLARPTRKGCVAQGEAAPRPGRLGLPGSVGRSVRYAISYSTPTLRVGPHLAHALLGRGTYGHVPAASRLSRAVAVRHLGVGHNSVQLQICLQIYGHERFGGKCLTCSGHGVTASHAWSLWTLTGSTDQHDSKCEFSPLSSNLSSKCTNEAQETRACRSRSNPNQHVRTLCHPSVCFASRRPTTQW